MQHTPLYPSPGGPPVTTRAVFVLGFCAVGVLITAVFHAFGLSWGWSIAAALAPVFWLVRKTNLDTGKWLVACARHWEGVPDEEKTEAVHYLSLLESRQESREQ